MKRSGGSMVYFPLSGFGCGAVVVGSGMGIVHGLNKVAVDDDDDAG